MDSKKFRVEVFITPKINSDDKRVDCKNNSNFVNELRLNVIEEVAEIDNENKENISNIVKCTESTVKHSFCRTSENLSDEIITRTSLFPQNLDITNVSACNNNSSDNKITIENDDNVKIGEQFRQHEEHIYDEPFVGNLKLIKVEKSNQNLPNSRYFQRYLPRPPKRTSSLKSIDESIEIFEQTFQDICCHGHKNGCTVAVPNPEEVSREIFKENWLQKLDSLRQREALLRDKEVALQSQERLLFKKERQLRILERLVNDKMRQAELYLKRCKQLPGFENLLDTERSSESGFSHSSKSSKCSKSENGKEAKDGDEIRSNDSHIYDEINMKNPPNSRSSLVTTSTEVMNKQQNNLMNVQCVRTSKFGTHNSFRLKQKPRQSYDDLDSTLSADIGDSSFAVTATKFNPDVFKKPVAFQRSISERRPTFSIAKTNFNTDHHHIEHGFKETKILKKCSENIMVSKNKDTKFQNYGLIDKEQNMNSNEVRPKSANDAELISHKKHSYTNCDKERKGVSIKNLKKERPTSWNAENDDWLRKKRQEYNMSMKRVSVVKNKENQQVKTNIESQVKTTKKEKKDCRGRRFMIFR